VATSTGNGRRCAALTRDGTPCQAWAGDGSKFCYWHDPERAEDRQRARAKGGRARHGRTVNPPGGRGPVTIETAADVLPILQRAINDVLALENSISRARALGYLAGQVVKAFEVTELQERVEVLEVALSKRGRG